MQFLTCWTSRRSVRNRISTRSVSKATGIGQSGGHGSRHSLRCTRMQLQAHHLLHQVHRLLPPAMETRETRPYVTRMLTEGDKTDFLKQQRLRSGSRGSNPNLHHCRISKTVHSRSSSSDSSSSITWRVQGSRRRSPCAKMHVQCRGYKPSNPWMRRHQLLTTLTCRNRGTLPHTCRPRRVRTC